MKRLISVLLSAALLAFALPAFVGCEKATVEGPAGSGKKLTLTKPSDQTLVRGKTNEVRIAISRTGFRDPVSIRFENLPAGVTVQDMDRAIKADDTSTNFTLKAEPTADLVQNQEVRVTATATDGLSITETFRLTVKDK